MRVGKTPILSLVGRRKCSPYPREKDCKGGAVDGPGCSALSDRCPGLWNLPVEIDQLRYRDTDTVIT